MIVLHASFEAGRLLLWAEQEAPTAAARRGGREKKATPHALSPYDVKAETLQTALAGVAFPAVAETPPTGATVWLPTSANRPLVSSPLIAEPPDADATFPIAPWQVTAFPLTTEQTVLLLCTLLKRDTLASGVLVGASLAYWATALRFAGALVAQQQFLPDVAESKASYRALWQPCYSGADTERLHKLARAMPDICRALTSAEVASPPETPALTVLSAFLTEICDHLVRTARTPEPAPPASRRTAKARTPAFDSLHDQWLYALQAAEGGMTGDRAELKAFAAQIREWKRPLSLSLAAPFRLCFRLEEPPVDGDGPVRPNALWNVRYLLQASDDPSLLVPAEKAWKPKGSEAKLLQRGGFQPREYLLSSLGYAAKVSPDIENSLRSATPGGYAFETPAAHQFLTETAWMLEQAGFAVLLPAWWTRKGTKLRLTAHASVKSPKLKASAGLSLNTLVEFDWEVALGGQALTHEELEALAQQKTGLVRMRGQWVQLDAQEIAAAVRFWNQRTEEKAPLRDVVRMALGAGTGPGGLAIDGVQATGWVEEFLARLNGQGASEMVPVPAGFAGTLRPYQQRGYAWMEFLRQWGLGACLADDMGLGKTAQTLALILRQWKEGDKRPTLIVCPTSVVGNWQKEAQRFTPELPVMVHHGLGRIKGTDFQKEAETQAIVLSSFALLHRDFEMLKEVFWAGLILDEAQNIKNPETKQARAARSLPADYRIALTGTPVENHVGDLWSLMEFLNPGFLGSQAEFRRKFFVPIQTNSDPEAALRLKRLTGPFLLRRLKTDTSIISDLPEKMEMKVFCTLTPEQATLYRAVVKELEETIEGAEGIQRSGMVLATLSKVKQICNHPTQFLGDNSAIPGRSGKLARLTEMLEEALAAGDKALLFSQFAEMGHLLQKHLQETFGREVLFLHGGTPKKQRDRMVERFQEESDGPRLFILSLKAGGTGLNLTAANHVFHFDRWWNPAVENQATDRAFRIGQKKNVQVHKFLCVGTLEERIDEMIESKKALAGSVVGTGEEWLTKLSNTELKELFTLRSEAVSG